MLHLPCPPDAADAFISRPPPEVLTVLSRHPGPILVLGAGGKIGLHVTAMLHAAGQALGRREPVTGVSRFRSLRSKAEFERLGLLTRTCDLEDPAALAALPDAPTVFFLAGIKFGTANAPELLQRLNVEMPRRVAERFRKSRIIAFSSGAVYPFVPVNGPGASESTPRGPVGDYARSCVEREKSFEAVSAEHGTRVVLIRLNYAVEFRYGVLVDIAQKVQHGKPIDLTMGRLNLIWQTDAVSHSVQAMELADSPAVPLNITGPHSYSVRELAERLGELFGVSPKFTGNEAQTTLLSDAGRAVRQFGSPTTSIEEMIAWTAAWQRDVGTTWSRPTGFETRDGTY